MHHTHLSHQKDIPSFPRHNACHPPHTFLCCPLDYQYVPFLSHYSIDAPINPSLIFSPIPPSTLSPNPPSTLSTIPPSNLSRIPASNLASIQQSNLSPIPPSNLSSISTSNLSTILPSNLPPIPPLKLSRIPSWNLSPISPSTLSLIPPSTLSPICARPSCAQLVDDIHCCVRTRSKCRRGKWGNRICANAPHTSVPPKRHTILS